jgi:arsenate reductase (thioredoxin)
MANHVFNVLFLCTHNSARSVMAEAIVTMCGGSRFKGFSAGSFPSGRPNPFAVEQALAIGYPLANIRSKSWDEFVAPDAPLMDIIITVCDNAAGEVCPIWLGHPATAHWGFADPSTQGDTDAQRRAAFSKTFAAIKAQIAHLVALTDAELIAPDLGARLTALGTKISSQAGH